VLRPGTRYLALDEALVLAPAAAELLRRELPRALEDTK
jgi:hypothetical protein